MTKEQSRKGKDDEGVVDSRWAVDRGMCGARIRDRSRDRDGGLVINTYGGGGRISGMDAGLTGRALSI